MEETNICNPVVIGVIPHTIIPMKLIGQWFRHQQTDLRFRDL